MFGNFYDPSSIESGCLFASAFTTSGILIIFIIKLYDQPVKLKFCRISSGTRPWNTSVQGGFKPDMSKQHIKQGAQGDQVAKGTNSWYNGQVVRIRPEVGWPSLTMDSF